MFSILALAPNPWHGQWVNRQYLLSRLADTHQVVYSNGAWFSWQRSSDAWRLSSCNAKLTSDAGVQVETPPRWLLRYEKVAVLDRLVLRLHARSLERHISRADADYVCMMFHPEFEPYLDHLRPGCLVYHAYDLFESTPGWTEVDDAREQRLLSKADLVTTVTPFIANRLLAKGAKSVHVIPNGVDVELFSAARGQHVPAPVDLMSIPEPRLGYVGSLHPQIDFALMAEIAVRRPDWHLVLIGDSPAHSEPRAARDIARCRMLPNVHFLGPRSRMDVPAYMLNMTVQLMPYRLSEDSWVMAGHPLKLYEYFASGRPVVAAELPALKDQGKLLAIAHGTESWIDAIDRALRSDDGATAALRIAEAHANGWDRRADAMKGLLLQAWQGRHGQTRN